jgi:uncharacterized membrane protein
MAEIIPIALVILAVLGTPIVLSIIALIKVLRRNNEIVVLFRELSELKEKLSRLEKPSRVEAAPVPPEPAAVEAPEPAPPAARPPDRAPVPPPAWQSKPFPVRPVPAAAAAPGRDGWTRFEEVIGKRWMTWLGAFVLFLSAGFFVKYAIDNRWLGPTGRIVLGILFGIGLLVWGDRSFARGMRIIGQGLTGAGLAVLYVSLFGAFSLYHLLPQTVAFAAMVLVTAGGMALAVLHDAVAVGILAVLGGILTPVMVSTGRDARDVLFAYLTLLGLGVLGVAFFRRWRSLEVLIFIGTWVLFSGWYAEYYREKALLPALFWLSVFYLIFLFLPFAHHLKRGTPSTVERFILALANAAVAFAFAYRMLRTNHTHVLGFMALGMAACYVILGAVTRRRIPGAAPGLFGFVGLAVVFLTLAVPLHLRFHGITLAWAVEGPILLFLGYRYRYFPVRVAGFLVLVLAAARLFSAHWPLHEALFRPILNRHFGSAICIPAAALAYLFIQHRRRNEAGPVDRVLKVASGIGAGFLILILLHEEVGQFLHYLEQDYLSRCSPPLIWAAGSAVFLAVGIRARSLATRLAGLGALSVGLFLATVLARPGLYGYDYYPLLTARYGARLAAVLMIFVFALAFSRCREVCSTGGEQILTKVLYGIGTFFLFVFLSFAAYEYSLRVTQDTVESRWIAMMAVTLVWGLFAAALLVLGFRRSLRSLRLTSLGLFLLTALKLVIFDMAEVKQIYRIVAFIVLGLLMISASYLYHRAEKRLKAAGE